MAANSSLWVWHTHSPHSNDLSLATVHWMNDRLRWRSLLVWFVLVYFCIQQGINGICCCQQDRTRPFRHSRRPNEGYTFLPVSRQHYRCKMKLLGFANILLLHVIISCCKTIIVIKHKGTLSFCSLLFTYSSVEGEEWILNLTTFYHQD